MTRRFIGSLKRVLPGFVRVNRAHSSRGPVFAGGAHSFLLMLAVVLALGSSDKPNRPPFRFAFSTRMFIGVNENDAKAAVKAWAQGLAKERNINLDGQPTILQSQAELVEALRSQQVDCVSLTTDDYLTLAPDMQNTNLLVSSISGRTTEQYLLLVHVKSGISSPADLKGRSLVMLDHVRASLAPIWLDVLLVQEGLALPARHFSQIRSAQKLTAVVLPVFFRQQAACVVTRSGFDTMSELNPQIRAQLKPLAASPELVPAFTFLRPDYRGAPQDEIVAEVLKMHLTPSGKQILTLFQTDLIEHMPASVLMSARELIETRRRLIPASGEPPRGEAGPSPKANSLP
ncbi:MAG: PhnD/SsuA/transferrin family substrate-binding protein [Verrucomicrobia bacterium]|nr:PhnD/SsuA/transferrin family substrate-binding protein [Verrucomicrobiota bacterium]